MGKPWGNQENHRKTMGKQSENHGKTRKIKENQETHRKTRKIIGKPWENHGKTRKIKENQETHRKTMGKPGKS